MTDVEQGAPTRERDAHRTLREKRARLSSWTSLAGRGLGMLVSIVVVPLTLRVLGTDRYGIWTAVGSFLGWLAIADLGIGSGVTNAIAETFGRDDRVGGRRVATSATFLVLVVTLCLTVVCAVLLVALPWRTILNAPAEIRDAELTTTLWLCVGIFLVGFVIGPLERLYTGYQESYVLNYFAMASSAGMMLAILTVPRVAAGMPGVAIALTAVPLVPRLVSVYVLLTRLRPWLMPAWRFFDGPTAKRLLRTGIGFLIPQLAFIGIWQTDNIVVLHLFGAEAVTTYSIVFKLPTTAVGLLAVWLAPLWPAYAEAQARGDMDWVRRTYARTLKRALAVSCTAAVGLIVAGEYAVAMWTGNRVIPALDLLAADAIYIPIFVWCTVHASVLNGLGRVRGQAYYGAASAVLNIVLSIVLGRLLGLAGVSWATSAATLVPAALSYAELQKRLRSR